MGYRTIPLFLIAMCQGVHPSMTPDVIHTATQGAMLEFQNSFEIVFILFLLPSFCILFFCRKFLCDHNIQNVNVSIPSHNTLICHYIIILLFGQLYFTLSLITCTLMCLYYCSLCSQCLVPHVFFTCFCIVLFIQYCIIQTFFLQQGNTEPHSVCATKLNIQ